MIRMWRDEIEYLARRALEGAGTLPSAAASLARAVGAAVGPPTIAVDGRTTAARVERLRAAPAVRIAALRDEISSARNLKCRDF